MMTIDRSMQGAPMKLNLSKMKQKANEHKEDRKRRLEQMRQDELDVYKYPRETVSA